MPFHNIWENITCHFSIFGRILYAISQYLGEYYLPFHNIWEIFAISQYLGGYHLPFHNVWGEYYLPFYNIREDITCGFTIFGRILLAISKYLGGNYLICHNIWGVITYNFTIIGEILYSYFMPVCSIVKTITLRCCGRPDALLQSLR